MELEWPADTGWLYMDKHIGHRRMSRTDRIFDPMGNAMALPHRQVAIHDDV